MLGRFWESAWLGCKGIDDTKVPPWTLAGFICCWDDADADFPVLAACVAEDRCCCCVEESKGFDGDVAATGLVGLEVEGSGLLSRVLFFLRKPREGIGQAGAASHVARQIGGDRVELVQRTGDRVEAGYAGVSSKGIAPQGGWMFGAVAGASGRLGGL